MLPTAKSKLKIVMITSECVPYAKTGGLADVVGALPQTLRRLGHEVIVVMPRYGIIDGKKLGLSRFWDSMGVWMGNELEWCAVDTADNGGAPTYFVESDKYFARPGLYHDADFIKGILLWNVWDKLDTAREMIGKPVTNRTAFQKELSAKKE